jgi:serine/threonine protein kinase/predicted Zn-dependent protease
MSQEDTLPFDETGGGDDNTLGNLPTVSDDPAAARPGSPQTDDQTIDDASSLATINGPVRTDAPSRETAVFAPGEITNIHGSGAASLQNTVGSAPAGQSRSSTDDSAGFLGNTIEDMSAPSSGATTEFSVSDHPRTGKMAPSSFAAPRTGVENGPSDYEILSELGRGGMGVVYKARHRRLNRLVALKMIRGAYADEIQIARFKIEAEAVAALRHPNILQIYDIGEINGSPYVALELLEGGSLVDKLRGALLPPRRAAEWMVPLVLAIDTAHRAGIVHRDLKSANVLFTADGIPKITDFGLAKRLEMDEGQTHTGQVMGTPSYMAPEQARGDTKSAGPPADIYALGAILYEMLTGRPPFKGVSAMDTVKQVLEAEPVSPSRVQFRVPRDLETICLKCLQKEPRKRYATAKDMADDLNRYLFGEPILARRTPPVERAVKWARRRPTLATVLGFAILGVISSIAAGTWYSIEQRRQERIAQKAENDRRQGTNNDLYSAQEAMSKSKFDEARVVLEKRKALLDEVTRKSPEVAALYDRTKLKLAEVNKALEVEAGREAKLAADHADQKRYQTFLNFRKEALFRDTQFPGDVPGLADANSPALTRKAAEAALGVFARREHDDDWTLGELPVALSSKQQSDVREGCYELLLILADAMANQGPEHVDGGLRVLESADRLRPAHSQPYYQRKASLLARKNDREGEARELDLARQTPPETAFDHFLSGQYELSRKPPRLPEAIQCFEASLRQQPDQFWAECQLANCYIQTSRFEAAKVGLTDCLESEPNLPLLYLLRGVASGRIATRYLNLVKTSPGVADRLKAQAEFEFGEAEKDFTTGLDQLKSTPDDERRYALLLNRGNLRVERGHLDEATADYLEAIRVNQDAYVAYGNLARVYELQEKPAQAIEQYTQAIALKPDWPPLYRGRAEALADRADSTPAQREAVQNDLKLAIKYERPDNPVLAQDHTRLGELLYRDSRPEDALAETKLALKIFPNYEEAHRLQIRVLLSLKRYDEAMLASNAALATVRNSAFLYELRGEAYDSHHDYAQAIRDYSRALDLRPNDARLHIRRGWSYLVLDSAKLALADFEAAINIDPNSADAYTGRGMARVKMGDQMAGVVDARAALRHGGTDPRVTYNAARIFAVAATIAASEVGEKGRLARPLSQRYQDEAVKLIREAFEREAPQKRAAFWRDTVQSDPALKAIRRRLKFEELVATNAQPTS